ncbi:probable galacturonosyltransferase 6 [Malania oleifera]|uniref:probable galacturonosyltransferase 6 n=1 Tax=Malania oleifera TaxID=397392 RepID=UPI0025AE49E5|nr:probable galacturonosyltransferase 6 [Malania oleifera]
MKQVRRWQRILILFLLGVSVLAPIVLVSSRLKGLASPGRNEFIEDLNNIKYRTDALHLRSIELEADESLKEPPLFVYKDGDLNSIVNYNSSNLNLEAEESISAAGRVNSVERDGTNEDKERNQKKWKKFYIFGGKKDHSGQAKVQHDQNVQSRSQRATDEKVKEIKDQLLRAKTYLTFAPPKSSSHLVKELKTRMKEVGRALGGATKDSDMSRSTLQKMRSMEATLSKAGHVYNDCSAMVAKLRAMTYNTEEQARTQKNEAAYLVHLASRTTPKGLHCLSMRLIAEYFALQPEERELPSQHKFYDPDLYHFVVFSDNILASAVVVNSTISAAMEPEKIVFHVVTDSLNLPAISMWFLLNPPGKAAIQIQSMDDFKWLPADFSSKLKNQGSRDPRYTSALNHLRFYLPDIFPALDKILFLDHDVVVKRDLTRLWGFDMKGKVIGVVETCQEGASPFRRLDMLINFSDPIIAKKFDVKACTWAFGMNVCDLRKWRRRNLTAVYEKYLQLGFERPLWKAGSLPLGWVTFYNQTTALDRRWHVVGLGHDSTLELGNLERAAVIHYDGILKPWLDVGIGKYKGYWSKHVKYDHPYLQECNLHE